MDTNRSEHVRKLATGACMIAAPLVFVVAEAIHPDDKTEAVDQYGVIAGGLDRWYTAHVLEIVAFMLLVGAVLGLAHLLHERRPATAVVGGGLALMGIVGITAAVGAEGLGGYYIVKSAGRAQAVNILDDMMNGSRLFPFFALSLLISVGVVVMAVGLWRTRVVAAWDALALVAGSVLIAFAGPAGIQPLAIVAMVLLFAGFAPIGYLVMTESDADWAHTPEYHGFRRPAMGAPQTAQ